MLKFTCHVVILLKNCVNPSLVLSRFNSEWAGSILFYYEDITSSSTHTYKAEHDQFVICSDHFC